MEKISLKNSMKNLKFASKKSYKRDVKELIAKPELPASVGKGLAPKARMSLVQTLHGG